MASTAASDNHGRDDSVAALFNTSTSPSSRRRRRPLPFLGRTRLVTGLGRRDSGKSFAARHSCIRMEKELRRWMMVWGATGRSSPSMSAISALAASASSWSSPTSSIPNVRTQRISSEVLTSTSIHRRKGDLSRHHRQRLTWFLSLGFFHWAGSSPSSSVMAQLAASTTVVRSARVRSTTLRPRCFSSISRFHARASSRVSKVFVLSCPRSRI